MIKPTTRLKSLFVSVLSVGILAGACQLAAESPVVISEVAWSGTKASWADEWMELRNQSDEKVDLSGWTIVWNDTKVNLGKEKNATATLANSVIKPGEAFLLERTDDEAVSSTKADVIYKASLPNEGTKIVLKDEQGDKADVVDATEGWMAGTSADGDPSYASMELLDGKWKTHKAESEQKDANGKPICGTPGKAPAE